MGHDPAPFAADQARDIVGSDGSDIEGRSYDLSRLAFGQHPL